MSKVSRAPARRREEHSGQKPPRADRAQHKPDRAQHEPDRAQHEPDRAQHKPDRAQHKPDRAQHKPDRAQQKLETRRRIRDAAWELFVELGYDGTTTKAVAERAGVAAGTVFVHARDKPDLLMMVMHDRLAAAVDEGFGTLPRKEPLLAQLLHVFQTLFAMYGEHPLVTQAFLKAFPGANGPNGERLHALTFAFLHRIAGLVRDAQARGEVAGDIDPLLAAHNVFALYFAALLAWVSGFATLSAALDPFLKGALALQLRGLRP